MLTALVRTQTKEDFLHFAVCLQRLLSALGTLQVIKASPDHPLAVPAFRFALVEYSMPYTDSRGSEKPYYKLKDSYVPKEHLALHKKILEARHTLHAHADLTVMSAKVFVTKTRGMPSATVSGMVYPGLLELNNIDQILSLIEGTRKNMFADLDHRLAALQP